MDRDNDRDYYARREQAERDLADRCNDEAVGRIHRSLADLYSERARRADVVYGPMQPDHI